MWDIIKQVLDNNQRQLTLTGADIDKYSEDIVESGLFSLTELNLLRICKSSLTVLPEELSNLKNLTNLVCQLNKLEAFPKSVGLLSKLTLLDVSSNELKELPQEIGKLDHLASLNVSCNKLKALPSLKGCKNLALLDASHNEIENFPDVSDGYELLADVVLSNNKIPSIPPSVGTLACLKKLNLENNSVLEVPGNLIDCPKLKVVLLCGNALKDRRLRKLVENPRTQPDQVLKYIKQHCPKQSLKEQPEHQNGASEEQQDQDTLPAPDAQSLASLTICQPTITITYPSSDLYVTVTGDALLLRPYLVCCLVSGMDLLEDRFKRFIALQNKLHDGICGRRLQSTIATHDLTKIVTTVPPVDEDGKGSEGLTYTTQPKQLLSFVPLNRRSKPVTAAKFLNTLQVEAENHRKQQKGNSLSGLYKYLQLVKGWAYFPCLLDAAGTVLSVPPLTNADGSKITADSQQVLLEVTSDKGLPVCKATMTELLQTIMEVTPGKSITVQQVRVLGDDGGLRCVFPASNDLTGLAGVLVVRPGK